MLKSFYFSTNRLWSSIKKLSNSLKVACESRLPNLLLYEWVLPLSHYWCGLEALLDQEILAFYRIFREYALSNREYAGRWNTCQETLVGAKSNLHKWQLKKYKSSTQGLLWLQLLHILNANVKLKHFCQKFYNKWRWQSRKTIRTYPRITTLMYGVIIIMKLTKVSQYFSYRTLPTPK